MESPQSQISIKTLAVQFQATANQPLIGGSTTSMMTADGSINIIVPASLFPWVEHKDIVYLTLSVFRVGVEPVPPASPLILPQ